MSECFIEDAKGACHCDNCPWEGDADELDLIADIEQRLDAGGLVPAGQCPNCGALAYLDNAPDWSDAAELAKQKKLSTELLDIIEELLGACELNLDEMEPETIAVRERANALVVRLKGEVT